MHTKCLAMQQRRQTEALLTAFEQAAHAAVRSRVCTCVPYPYSSVQNLGGPLLICLELCERLTKKKNGKEKRGGVVPTISPKKTNFQTPFKSETSPITISNLRIMLAPIYQSPLERAGTAALEERCRGYSCQR